mmetsp:Transcript_17654/g.46591  ORF Transcript_17654/g.46591 Transcript_17654/m.46591 type:complete len:369 (+) Transcript_17654:47-1153(+)
MVAHGVAAFFTALLAVAVALRRRLESRIAHIQTGAERRAVHPVSAGIGAGAIAALADETVNVYRELYTLRDGSKAFCQVISPAKCAPTYILVFFHGYCGHGDLYIESMVRLARQGAIVILPDMPCHGRSDGLLAYIPHWWSWVDKVWEIVDLVLPGVRKLTQKRLNVFASGCSLGGGLVACLAIQRPAFFEGLVLVCPMLVVHDHVKPSWIVEQIFKHLLAKLLPTLPAAPTKDLASLFYRVEQQGTRYADTNPFSLRGLKPRLGTALQLGFAFPDWMKHQLANVRAPFLVLHGAADRITDPSMSQRLHDQAASTDKQIKIYDGACHSELLDCLPGKAETIGMEFLPEQTAITDACLADVAAWLAARS